MTTDEIAAICDQRLALWAAQMVREHSTPVALLGIGHDHVSGHLILCALRDAGPLDDASLAALLRKAADALDGGT